MKTLVIALSLLLATPAIAADCGPVKSVMPPLHANGYEVAGGGNLGDHKLGQVWVNDRRDWVILRVDPNKDEVCVIWRGTEWLGKMVLAPVGQPL